jgi:glycerol-1-phosphate dehydrogenase [NAD(P)+]
MRLSLFSLTRTTRVTADDFIIQSHRGAGVMAPENSLEAFALGWSMGCCPECDVRTTRDGVLVAFHDENFQFVRSMPEAMRSKSVADVMWDELSRFDFHGAPIATLAEIVARMQGRPKRRLYLDIKDVDLERLAAAVRTARVESRVVLSSTHHPPLRRWQELLPASQTLLWMGGDEAALRQRLLVLRKDDFAGITQLQVHVHRRPDLAAPDERSSLVPSEKFITNLAKELRARGILFQALPYDGGGDAETYRRLLDMGVESFATDHPTVAIEAVRTHLVTADMDAAVAAASDTRAIVIDAGAQRHVVRTFREQFGDAFPHVIADTNTVPIAARVLESFRAAGSTVRAPFVFDDAVVAAEHTFVERLESHLRVLADEVIPIAVGAGTINDLVKLAAHRVGRPYMVVATAASMDGYTAYGASITYQGSKQTFDCPAPRAVLADLDVIRAAPRELNAAGYADLLAKLTAGADWILADELGVEPIDDHAWSTVQRPLRRWLSDPAGVRDGNPEAIRSLVEGLMMSGLAMQATRSSRPASGAEHQFSHLWDMQHHVDPRTGIAPSHGFKVGVAMVAVTEFYERLLQMPLDQLEIDAALARWPTWPDERQRIEHLFADEPPSLRAKAVEESQAKHVDRAALRDQLALLKSRWPTIRHRLRDHLPPSADLREMLHEVAAPTEPPQIGLTPARLRDSFQLAYHLRRRFTVLDVAMRADVFDTILPPP